MKEPKDYTREEIKELCVEFWKSPEGREIKQKYVLKQIHDSEKGEIK